MATEFGSIPPRTTHALASHASLGWDKGGLRTSGAALVAGGLLTGIFNALHPLPAETMQGTLEGILGVGVLFWKFDHLMLMVGFWLLAWGFIGIHRAIGTSSGATMSRLGFYGILMGTAAWTIHDAFDGFARATIAAEWASSTGETRAILFQIAGAIQHITDASFPLTATFYWLSLGIMGIAIMKSRCLPRPFGPLLGLIAATVVGLAVYALFYGFGGLWDILFAVFATLTVVWAVAAGAWMLWTSRTWDG